MINIYIFFFVFVNICLSNSDAAKKIQSYNYSGGWPINLEKKQLTENFDSANLNCPNGLGCFWSVFERRIDAHHGRHGRRSKQSGSIFEQNDDNADEWVAILETQKTRCVLPCRAPVSSVFAAVVR